MNYHFDRLSGPLHSREQNFEQMMAQLLALDYGASAIDGSGGDGGIDCYVMNPDGMLTIFQSKYYIDRLTSSRKNQIRRSFERAVKQHNVRKWVLCVPLDPTPAEDLWLRTISRNMTEVEWFGVTKIRTLLAKYPRIAGQFFSEDVLTQQLQELRSWLGSVMEALSPTPWALAVPSGQDMFPIPYLERVQRIAAILSQDHDLIDDPTRGLIAVDFSDIYLYLTGGSHQFVATAVLDYVFTTTSEPLQLFPGSVAEIHRYLIYLTESGQHFVSNQADPQERVRRLDKFMAAYAAAPHSRETQLAFEECVSRIGVESYGTILRIPELLKFINSGRIEEARLSTRVLENAKEYIEPILQAFLKIRATSRPISTYVDSWNLAILKSLRVEGMISRMLSSAKTMHLVAESTFDDPSPLRTSCDMAYLLHLQTKSREGVFGSNLPMQLMKLRKSSAELVQVLNLRETGDSKIPKQTESLQKASRVLHEFEPGYRSILKPIDEIIVNASRELPRTRFIGMVELYEFITREATIIEGFRQWWDRVIGVLGTLDALLHGQNAYDHLPKALTKTRNEDSPV
jgi:hypothetical protein